MVLLRNVSPRKTEKGLNTKAIRTDDSWQGAFKGTNGSGIKFMKKIGKHKSDNVTLIEVAIDKKVLRIPLTRYDLKDLKTKLVSRRSILLFERNQRTKRKTESFSTGRTTVNLNGITKRGTIVLSKSTKLTDKEKREKSVRTGNKFVEVSSGRKREISQKSKTLNRSIQKPEKKFKIRLFSPKKVAPNKRNIDKFIKSMDKSFGRKPCNLSYFLRFKDERNILTHGKLNYTFQKLVTDVKDMKLPSPTWKIKVIIRQNKIYAVTFTNKLDLERSVSFTSENDNYKIVIDNEQAFLLGSPAAVNNAQDIEVLLDIVENIEKKDPMVLYK